MIPDKTTDDIVLYRVSDIQKIFGCGRKKAYEIVHLKDFPSFRVDGVIYVEKDALKKWISKSAYKNIFTR